ncbi:MAG TPA: invasin domain 3-containing protein [Thermoanaerobaculia bacterium]|nr:invasin domain 3-containing protein [Thermoanaerobaculia bacterium]
MKQAVGLLALLCLLAPSLGCDKATPVAPGGTTLTLSANPTRIGLNGSSTITVIGRKPDGNPLNPGTEIRLSSDRGTIDPVVTVDSGGQATATLRADGRSGAALVKASTADATVETTIQIGESDDTKPTLLVSVNPSTVPVEGNATVTVIARNSDGSPVPAGQTVILTSTLGTLSPNRPTTRNDGTATSTLDAGTQSGTATITAILGASEAASATVTIREAATDISVQANPSAIPRAGAEVTLTAFVTNSQGLPLQGAPVTFEASRGDLEFTGVVFTDTSGVATNTLTLEQQDLPAGVNEVVVEVGTPGGDGDLLTDETTIDVQ